MQTWQEQAVKNNLSIVAKGHCQLCGAKMENGLSECIENSAAIINKLNHEAGIRHMTLFLCVDSYALQHSEIHGRWNNHFHLSRLHLMIIKKTKWNYKLSPILSSIVDLYKKTHLDETISTPEVKKRGLITITNIGQTTSDLDYINLVNRWAMGAYESFVSGHEIAVQISQLFLKQINANT